MKALPFAETFGDDEAVVDYSPVNGKLDDIFSMADPKLMHHSIASARAPSPISLEHNITVVGDLSGPLSTIEEDSTTTGSSSSGDTGFAVLIAEETIGHLETEEMADI